MRPSRLTLLLAAAGTVLALLPTFVHPQAWTFWPLFWGGLALAMGADLILSARKSEVACHLEAPLALSIGEPEDAHLTVRVPSRRRVPFTLAVDLSGILEPVPPVTVYPGPGGAKVAVRLVPKRRGTATIERAWVRYPGPLGLVETVARIGLDHAVPVVPNSRPVRTIALRMFTDRDFRAGLKVERYLGDGTEFESLKEYVQGDDHRAIDWKASARHRKTISRQYRAERNHQVILAVDTGHLMEEPIERVPRLDHAINAALLLAFVCLKTGDRVGLFTFDARVGLSTEPAGSLSTHRVLTQLSGQIEYSNAETNFTLGLTTLSSKLRRRSLVVVLTDFVDTVTAELMIDNLGRLARRHVVLFVALQDPGLARIADQPPRRLHELNQAVVADSLLRDREVVLKRLQRLGITCVDAPPSSVGPDLVNQYLDIKRRERV